MPESTERIAAALEALVKLGNERNEIERQRRNLLNEDLIFRREQAEKSEQQQATFLKMFLSAAQPNPLGSPSPFVNPNPAQADKTSRRKRRAEGK